MINKRAPRHVDKMKLPEIFHQIDSIPQFRCILGSSNHDDEKELSRLYKFRLKGVKDWEFCLTVMRDGRFETYWTPKGGGPYMKYDLDQILDKEDLPEGVQESLTFNLDILRKKSTIKHKI